MLGWYWLLLVSRDFCLWKTISKIFQRHISYLKVAEFQTKLYSSLTCSKTDLLASTFLRLLFCGLFLKRSWKEFFTFRKTLLVTEVLVFPKLKFPLRGHDRIQRCLLKNTSHFQKIVMMDRIPTYLKTAIWAVKDHWSYDGLMASWTRLFLDSFLLYILFVDFPNFTGFEK